MMKLITYFYRKLNRLVKETGFIKFCKTPGFCVDYFLQYQYFATMKICHHCKKEIKLESFTGRQEQCPFCRSDLHCCGNCTFYERGTYNDCRETQAERVLDKTRSNFCDFFSFRQTNLSSEKQPDARDKLDALFKK